MKSSTKIIFAVFLIFTLIPNSYLLSQDIDRDEISIANQPTYTSLAKALRNATKVYKLDLRNTGLKEFPLSILKLSELRILVLDSNQISILPKQIDTLQHLIYLSLSHNSIQEIPESVGNIKKLRFLYLNFNELTSLPKGLFKLNHLEELFINNNKLSELSTDVRFLQDLKVLIISHNKLESIPDEIGHLYDLRSLSLTNNAIKDLPEHFYELTNLKYLYFNENSLRKIDGRIKKLSKLEILTLDFNKLSTLPPELGELYSLTNLYLDHNNIKYFPSELGNLFKLKTLYIGNNNCESIPLNFGNLKNLQSIDIAEIAVIPFPQVLYDIQNNGTKVNGLKTKELYQAKLLLSQARNKKITGNVNESISLYEKLILLDTNNAFAMSEYALILLDSNKYDAAEKISKRGLSKNTTSKVLDELRITYSNSLNKTNKYEQVIDNYYLKIKSDSTHALPYYNLGKFYFDQAKYDEAKNIFKKAVLIEPSHAESHFYIAVTSLIEEKNEDFIFSALRLFLLEPKSIKTLSTFPFFLTKMKMKTGILGKNGSTHYYDSYIIKNDEKEIIYKSENSSANLLAAMLIDITKESLSSQKTLTNDTSTNKIVVNSLNLNKSNIELFQIELTRICNDDTTLSWTYYLKYYKALIESGNLQAFAHIIMNIRNEDPTTLNWIKNNNDKIEKFHFWNKNYNWFLK